MVIIYCIVLYCNELYCTLLYGPVLHFSILQLGINPFAVNNNNNNNNKIYATAYFDHSIIKQSGELRHEEDPDFMIYTTLLITYLNFS
jgi:hypothetical protein